MAGAWAVHGPGQQGSMSNVASELQLLQSDSRRTESKLDDNAASSSKDPCPGRIRKPLDPVLYDDVHPHDAALFSA